MMTLQPHRRSVVSGALGIGLATASGVLRASAGESPFLLGVASGAPTPDGFVLWTRLAREPLAPDGSGGMAGAVEVEWAIAEDESFARVARSGTALADPAWAHSVHVEIGGLRPGRDYYYRFTAQGVQSPAGRARTAPAANDRTQRLKLAIASCAHYEVGYFSAYRHMAQERPDLTLFLGDYIYEYSYAASNTSVVRRHEQAGELRDLAEYRNRYALHRLDADLQDLHAAAPCLAIWDDHEVQNDYAADFSQIGTIPEAEFHVRRIAAYRAFYEHMPLPASARPGPNGAMRLYGRHRFGDLAELTLLDERQYRSIQACTVGGSRRGRVAPLSCPDLLAPTRSMLGVEQELWLYSGYGASQTRWNLIGHGLMLSPYLQRASDGELGYFTDGWSGYGAARQRLLGNLKNSRQENTVLFGGDLHAYLAADIHADPQDPASERLAAEFIGTSITSNKAPDSIGDTLGDNPHVHMFDNAWRGYMTAEITPERVTTRFRNISDRTDPHAGVSTLKTFVVEDGRAGATEA